MHALAAGLGPWQQIARKPFSPKRFNAPLPVTLWRAARVALHLAWGVALVLTVFPRRTQAARNLRVQRWSAHLLRILAVQLDVTGTLTPAGTTPAMLVANHVSWLDIYVLNALCPAHFVAKSEVGRWPLIGLFARRSGTVFIDRARKRDILRVNAELANLMRAGSIIAVFPEGTTTEGDSVLTFRPPLLQAAVACGAHLQAVAIRYERPDGGRCAAAHFVGDTTLAAASWQALTQRAIHARVQLLPAVSCAGGCRKTLAHGAQRDVALALAPVNAGRKKTKP